MKRLIAFLATSLLLPGIVFAQFLPDQNQITQEPFGGLVYSTSTSGNAQFGQLIGNTYGQLAYWDGSKWDLIATTSLGLLFPPGGNNGEVQYNASGAFGGVATGTISANGGITTTSNRSAIGGALVISCDVASASVPGCLSSTDWSNFNAKLSSYDAFTHGSTFATTTSATTTSIWTQGVFFSSSTQQASQFPYASSSSITAGNLFATRATLTNALTVANGGTGATSLTGIVIGNGTSAFTADAVPLNIANGGTNSTTFTTSGNAVYYTGSLLATAPTNSKITIPYASSTVGTAATFFSTDSTITNLTLTELANTLPLTINAVSTFSGTETFIRYVDTGNIGFGPSALSSVSGNHNSAFGSGALGGSAATVSGSDNTAQGFAALIDLGSGSQNTAVGSGALSASGIDVGGGPTGGSNNTTVGYRGLSSLGTGGNGGDNNIAIGSQAGDNLTQGDSNIVIGTNIDSPSDSASNLMSIGNLIFGTGIDGTGKTISSGNIGIATTTPAGRLGVQGNIFVAGRIFSTSTASNVLPYASTTAITAATASTTALYVSNSPNAIALIGPDGLLGKYGGTTCTNQFIRILSAIGGATCATVSLTADITGTLPIANGGTNATSFATNGNGVYYNGTALSTAPLTSSVTYPYASTTAITSTNIFATTLYGIDLATKITIPYASSTAITSQTATFNNLVRANGDVYLGATTALIGNCSIQITSDLQPALPVNNCSVYSVTSNDTTSTNRSFCLVAGVEGQILTIYADNPTTNEIELVDGAAGACSGGSGAATFLNGVWPATTNQNNDTITLIYRTTAAGAAANGWFELSRSAN